MLYYMRSGKHLPAAVCLEPRKQKPLSDALDGLYLLCEEHMLPWYGLNGKEVMLAHCGGKQARDQKAPPGLDYIHVV